MKKLNALVAATTACLLAGSIATAQQTEPPVRETTDQTRPGRSATDDASRTQRTADASGMRRSKMDSAEFAKKAGVAGAAEVEAGKLGAQKATSPEVKAFAQKMVTDHTKGNQELIAAARAENVEVPTEPDLMHKGKMEKLKLQKADADFDHDFMQQMVRDHKAAVELYRNASTDTNVGPELRAFAKKTLPTLESHLEQAQELEGKLAKSQ